jgi:hypothetical protein
MAAASAPALHGAPTLRRLGIAWIAIWASLALHVADEAANGFLFIYNPTVTALRERFGFWPMPTFTFETWLGGLAIGILVLAALTPFAFRNATWMRPLFYFGAIVLCIANACGHTLATIFGRTVSTVHFPRPAPGFISSPVLLFAGIYALVQLRRTRKGA